MQCSKCNRNVGDKGDFKNKKCGHCVRFLNALTISKLKRMEVFLVEELADKIIEIEKHKLTILDYYDETDFNSFAEFARYMNGVKQWEELLHELYTAADKLCTELCTVRARLNGK